MPTTGKAQYDSYQILFTDINGHASAGRSAMHIEVDPDLPPVVEIVEPKQENGDLAEDGQLRIRVKAFDPDYALRRVAILGLVERKGQGGARQRKWFCRCSWTAPKPYKGLPAYANKDGEGYLFVPRNLHLKAGDVVRYCATAVDNKEPRPNQTIREPDGTADDQIRRRAGGPARREGRSAWRRWEPAPGERKSGNNGEGKPGENGQGDSSSKAEGTKGSDPARISTAQRR